MTSLRFARVAATLLLVSLFPLASVAGPVHDDYSPMIDSRGDCVVGNLNDPVGQPAEGIFHGDEAYAYLIWPEDQCTCTEGGFALEAYHQLLHFHQDQIPVTLQVTALLLEAVWDPSMGCWAPGPIIEETLPQTMTVSDPGLFLVNVPGEMPNFYDMAGPYFIAMRYEGGAEGQLAIDADPQPCIEYVNRGAGWQDLFFRDKTGGGKIIIWGDIVCGAPTVVPNEGQSWGSIKALFK